MTRPSSCIVATTLCCLLAFTASASAECAWVLWKESSYSPSSRTYWSLYIASESKRECDAAQERFTRVSLKSGQRPGTRRDIKDGAIITTLDDGTGKEIRREEFHCFPSAIDPRPRYKEE
jgi:hypothetical protein